MLVSIIIPTHNRADALDRTLEHLSHQQFSQKWEVIVANNNCTDNTDSIVKLWQEKFPVALILVHEKKPGASATRNTGAHAATGDYLVFIDNDILTEPNFVQLHFDALHQNPNSWIVGQVINMPEQETSAFGEYRKQLFPIVPIDEKIRDTDGITAATFSLPRENFVRLNGFDENFFVASSEDHDLAMRGRRQLGIRTLLVPKILVVHNDWAGWTLADFCLRQEMYARTEFLFWQKYGDNHPRLQLIQENLPMNWRDDSSKLLFRKCIKKLLGRKFSHVILLKISEFLEISPVFKPLLWRVYELASAGAIYKGFNEGRDQTLFKSRDLSC